MRNNEGETPLFLAAQHGKKGAFDALHPKCSIAGLRVLHDIRHCRKNDGNTILHVSIQGAYFGLIVDITKVLRPQIPMTTVLDLLKMWKKLVVNTIVARSTGEDKDQGMETNKGEPGLKTNICEHSHFKVRDVIKGQEDVIPTQRLPASPDHFVFFRLLQIMIELLLSVLGLDGEKWKEIMEPIREFTGLVQVIKSGIQRKEVFLEAEKKRSDVYGFKMPEDSKKEETRTGFFFLHRFGHGRGCVSSPVTRRGDSGEENLWRLFTARWGLAENRTQIEAWLRFLLSKRFSLWSAMATRGSGGSRRHQIFRSTSICDLSRPVRSPPVFFFLSHGSGVASSSSIDGSSEVASSSSSPFLCNTRVFFLLTREPCPPTDLSIFTALLLLRSTL
ncbi:NF-kappa-B inhibitor cactus [Cinnamomum micranthum f. kanehirae]|uniref:NF-kappa-B inhibitor cactus n=1 Tax=Cinnamomum micranthum f. kanehirae TaxID=337451 RepID=A0A3S3PY09_9MAGN|nr:NF-kappa-B inhibitor cactus [Cinnamomum micranthum f. kanehirae]